MQEGASGIEIPRDLYGEQGLLSFHLKSYDDITVRGSRLSQKMKFSDEEQQ